jgi:hypothetical protein
MTKRPIRSEFGEGPAAKYAAVDSDISPALLRVLKKRIASLDRGKGLTTAELRVRFGRRRRAKRTAQKA